VSDQNELLLEVETKPESTIVRCRGRLTLSSASALRDEVKRLLPHTRDIVIDLTDVTLLDSVGLGTIAALYASVRMAGCELHLINVTSRIRELFSVTRLLSLLDTSGDPATRIH
jgi:anti-sigma B factor antagonist